MRHGPAQEQGRECHHEVGEAHKGGAGPAPDITGDNAQGCPDCHGDAIGEKTDHYRGLCAEEKPRELIAAICVGAEPES
jgi:hypothetical protein